MLAFIADSALHCYSRPLTSRSGGAVHNSRTLNSSTTTTTAATTSPLRRPRSPCNSFSSSSLSTSSSSSSSLSSSSSSSSTQSSSTRCSMEMRTTRTTRCVFLPPDGGGGMSSTGRDTDRGGGSLGGGSERLGGGRGDAAKDQGMNAIDKLLEETMTWPSSPSSPSPYVRGGRDEWSGPVDYMQRHRHRLAPEEAFGAIFMFDVVVANGRELELLSWREVAAEGGYLAPDMEDIVRSERMAPEAAVSRVFLWECGSNGNAHDWKEVKKCVFRKSEIRAAKLATFEWRVNTGVESFLKALSQYGVKCVLCAYAFTKPQLDSILQTLSLHTLFNDTITMEDDDVVADNPIQLIQCAAERAQRPASQCIVFTEKPTDITAAHEAHAKVIATVGPYPAYDIKTADHVIASFEDLVVYNVRRLFSEDDNGVNSSNPYKLEPQPEPELERERGF